MKKLILSAKTISFGLVFFSLLFAIPAIGKNNKLNEQTCLAKNIYFEARDQGLAAQIAVSLVVMNRVNDNRYPNSICAVIYQGPTYSWKPDFPVRNKCQFSWYCDGKSDKPKDLDTWDRSLIIAQDLLTFDDIIDFTNGATHYHATHILPHWASHLTRVTQIEDHIFYRLEP